MQKSQQYPPALTSPRVCKNLVVISEFNLSDEQSEQLKKSQDKFLSWVAGLPKTLSRLESGISKTDVLIDCESPMEALREIVEAFQKQNKIMEQQVEVIRKASGRAEIVAWCGIAVSIASLVIACISVAAVAFK